MPQPAAACPEEGAGSGGYVSDEPLQGTPAHAAHRRVAVDVVPDRSHRLLECPRSASRPLHLVTVEVVAQHVPRFDVQQVPGGDEVERGVGRPEAADVDDTDETVV